MYHVAVETIDIATIGNGTNHTIALSALMQPLLNNMTSPLVLSNGVDGAPRKLSLTCHPLLLASLLITVRKTLSFYRSPHCYPERYRPGQQQRCLPEPPYVAQLA